ncbi:MAG: type III-B CRISPR-associated protein Cas10/Cmr2, partial [Candidatus Hadarchaeales archaeon]
MALLHDPPDKCWHVAGELPGDHEEIARRIRQRIGIKEFEEEEFNKLVKIGDVLSAGADRWFSEIYSKILGSPAKILRINPLSLQEAEVVKPSQAWPENWAEKLRDIFEKIQGTEEEKYKWFYHILYGFGELLYAGLYPGSIGPADTRIPHHSIFDHLCATASMINWLCLQPTGDEIRPRGFMLVLDLAGVQEYIRASKKMSDLDFSSLLISYLAWYLVEEVVDKIGPDILISPTCRMNPFYYRWLLSQLPANLSSDLRKQLEEITFEKKGPPAFALDTPAALLPSKLLLVLPPLPFIAKVLSFPEEEKQIAEYFVRR